MKRWIFHQNDDEHQVQSLSRELNIDSTLASVLIHRGVNSFDKARRFFRPEIDQLHDPFLMKDMEKAVACLRKHIQQNNRILVYGDYDVDGSTSVAMMYDFLSSIEADVEYYIPDRYKEGYGVSRQGIEFAIEGGFKLIITLDCGIKAVENIAYARSKNIDVIVCDHHLPEELPDATAILDPKQPGCTYPFKELSGCGVGFKLIHAYAQSNGIDFPSVRILLDLVAISIAADIVPLVEENRILMYYGLSLMNRSPRIGIKSILKVANCSKEVDVNDIVFGIAPRINAAGRIQHARLAVELLISDSESRAQELASEINKLNEQRRGLDETITREALEMLGNQEKYQDRRSTVLYCKDWHKGVVGIVASRLIESYYKPTIILAESDGAATGSARSVAGFDVYEAIFECRELLTKFGGHKYAAGLTLPIENIPEFESRFEQVVSERITSDQLIPRLYVDTELEFGKISHKYFSIINQMKPLGPGNMSPIFSSREVLCTNARAIGTNHLKLTLKQNGSRSYDAIGFGMAGFLTDIEADRPFSIAYSLDDNTYNGIKSIQLVVKDIKLKEN